MIAAETHRKGHYAQTHFKYPPERLAVERESVHESSAGRNHRPQRHRKLVLKQLQKGHPDMDSTMQCLSITAMRIRILHGYILL